MATRIIPATHARRSSRRHDDASSTGSTASTTGIGQTDTIAGNFQTFLTLLTTQLKNQNPLDPLDTNQFTSQLVQFAQVEQQLKANDQLATLVSLQQTAQNTAALDFVGQTVDVDGQHRRADQRHGHLAAHGAEARDRHDHDQAARPARQVFSGNYSLNAGTQPFVWDGKDSSGLQWPDGNYTISVTAQDASGQPVAIPTEIEAVVDSADLTSDPAGAFDRRTGLHARQNQARRPQYQLIAR